MNQETGFPGLAKPPHLRQLLGITEEYVSYCREERNFAAVLYHLLLDEKRLKSFLELIGQDADAVKVEDVRIYFEYAHLRDLWAEVSCRETIASKNERYRAAIVSMLRMPEGLELPSIDKDDRTGKDDCTAFNAFFTGLRVGAASKNHIQMPSRWSDSQFDKWSEFGKPFETPFEKQFGGQTFAELTFAERACSLKWAFNAKPDLVLHLGDNKAICIEAKLESGVGRYQVKSDQSGCFAKTQTDLQEFILRDLLGYDTDDRDFIIVSKNKNRKEGDSTSKWRGYSWQEVFEKLLKDQPPTAGESQMVALFATRELINH